MPPFDSLTRLPWRRADTSGWVGIYAETPQRFVAAYSPASNRARPQVQVAPVFEGSEPGQSLLQWHQGQHRRASANLLLSSVDYRILPLPTPAVPLAERREALRWQLADLIDFPADEACVDFVDVPGPALGAESRQVFAIAAQPKSVGDWMRRYSDARLTLGAVDIPEMAMRNLSVLCAGDSAHAFVHLGLTSTRLILVWQRELCSFRQFEVSAFKLHGSDAQTRTMLLERLALEIQRSTDAFSRLFHGADLRTVWVSAMRDAEEITQQLAQLLPQTMTRFQVEDHVELVSRDPVVDPVRGLDFTYAIGAALRRTEH